MNYLEHYHKTMEAEITKLSKLIDELQGLDNEIQRMYSDIARLTKRREYLVQLYVKLAPYYKIEYMAEENGEEYTYSSFFGYKHDFQWYVERAKARLCAKNFRLTKAYIWENIPHDDVNKELIGLYEPKLILTK